MHSIKHVVLAVPITMALAAGSASAVPITFSSVGGGVLGGSPAQTAVFKASLSDLGLGNILSITIADASGGVGGAPGQFSGFDLDAIILSTTDCANVACVGALAGLSVFDFSPAGTLFTPGIQRVPVDATLFGTGAAGNIVDNLVATLGAFDANSTTTIPGALGYVSLGDSGILSFNLTSAVSTTGLFLYMGEVGDNGEVAAGSFSVSDRRVPEPEIVWLLAIGLIAVARARFRRTTTPGK